MVKMSFNPRYIIFNVLSTDCVHPLPYSFQDRLPGKKKKKGTTLQCWYISQINCRCVFTKKLIRTSNTGGTSLFWQPPSSQEARRHLWSSEWIASSCGCTWIHGSLGGNSPGSCVWVHPTSLTFLSKSVSKRSQCQPLLWTLLIETS